MSYGQTETFGQIGSECPAQHGYHIDDFNLYSEIVDKGADGYGELVYSTLSREVMPLIRYRSTDITALIDGARVRGSLSVTRRLAKIRGRSDEMINCGMGNLSPWFFEQLLDDLPGITRDLAGSACLRTGNFDHDRIPSGVERTRPAETSHRHRPGRRVARADPPTRGAITS